MTRHSQPSHYELLDIAPDAKREEIALGYQRALEALVQQQDTDPRKRAALRRAFEVLVDPIQRMSYDLSARQYQTSPGLSMPASDVGDASDSQTLVERLWGTAWAKVLIGVLVLIGIILWARSGKPASTTPVEIGTPPSLPTADKLSANAGSFNSSAANKADTTTPSAATPSRGPRTAEDIFNQVSLSVVRINVANSMGSRVASGSGVVIGPGSVITNCHVAQGGETLEVVLGGESYAAMIEVANEVRDLCLLEVSGLVAPAVSLGSVDSVRVGQRVYAVGAPQGLDLTISDGIVSALRESQGSKLIQTSAPVSPGSSGGGLFDTNGRMIGVVTFQSKFGQNLNFALPADWVGEMRTR